jgi:hypothetical protein
MKNIVNIKSHYFHESSSNLTNNSDRNSNQKNIEISDLNFDKNLNPDQTLYSTIDGESTKRKLPNNEGEILIYNQKITNRKPICLGNTKNYFYFKEYPLISIGPDFFYPFLCILIMSVCYYVFINIFQSHKGSTFYIINKICFFLYLFFHSISTIFNPGIPSKKYCLQNEKDYNEKKLNELDSYKCKNCNIRLKVKDYSSHCSKCDICYINLDHHCQWIGHCVANNNKIFFYLFACSIWCYWLSCVGMFIIEILKYFIDKQKKN